MPPSRSKALIFLATYNEASNIVPIYSAIRTLLPDVDLLFVDDNYPDGTGHVIDGVAEKDSRVHVVHRTGKLGIGSAHKAGIRWASDREYEILLTMDCDMAHSPEYLPAFLGSGEEWAVVIGTRFTDKASLEGWTAYRKFLTHLGHGLTRILLRMPLDATGAFRRYDLRRIPHHFIDVVRSDSYSFFFESLHILFLNGFPIREIPIHLPPRTYGDSKMRIRDVFKGALFLFRHAARSVFQRPSLLLRSGGPAGTIDARDRTSA